MEVMTRDGVLHSSESSSILFREPVQCHDHSRILSGGIRSESGELHRIEALCGEVSLPFLIQE